MKNELALFIFIDAFGWELLKRHPDFLPDILPHRSRLESILGYSSTCDPTILTGLMPQDHGHFSFFVYDPENSPFALCRPLGILPKSITRRGRVRRMMSRAIKRLYGFTGYFQIYNMPFDRIGLFDYSEKRDLYEPGGINSGARTIFDHLRDNRVPYHLSDWRAGEERNLAALRRDLGTGEPAFAYVFLAAMDAVLHAEGTRSPRVDEKIAWYDRQLRDVLDIANRQYSAARVYAFSDHGMTDIHDVCDLMPRIESLGLRFGEDYAAVYDSTMARFWFLREAARGPILEALAAEPRGRILHPKDLEAYQCRFPGDRYGEVFFLMDPGVLLCPSFMGETPLAGMHGYDPSDKDTDAMFASNVALDPPPARLDGIFPLMQSEADAHIARRGA